MFLILPTGLTQGAFPKWAVMLNALDPAGWSRAPLALRTGAGWLSTGSLAGESEGSHGSAKVLALFLKSAVSPLLACLCGGSPQET